MIMSDAFAECRRLYEQRKYADALASCSTLAADEQSTIEALQLRAACLRHLERPSEVEKLLTPSVAERDPILQGELAYALYMNDKFEPAIEWATRALQENAKLEIAVKAKAGAHRFREDLQEAEQVLDKAFRDLPDSALVAGERAAFLSDLKHDSEAGLTEALRALDLDPTNDTALHIAIQMLSRNGRKAEAQERVRRALQHAPVDDAGTLTAAGRYSLEAGDLRTAVEAARKAQVAAPEYAAAYVLEAEALLLLDGVSSAIRVAAAAADRFPSSAELVQAVARLHTENGEFAAAEKRLQQMRDVHAPDDALWSVEIDLLGRQGKWLELRRLLTKIDREAKPSSVGRHMAAYAHVSMREFDEAEKQFAAFLPYASNNDLVYADYIALLIMMNRLKAAKNVVEEARRRWPKDPSRSISAMNAWLLANDGKYVAAHAAIDAERVEAETREWIHAIKIDVLIMQWRLKEAEEAAREALKQFPLSTRIHLNIAQIHLQRPNEQEKALAVIEDILRRDGSTTTAWQMKVAALRSLGRTKDAVDAVEEGLRRYPFSAGLITQRGMIRLYNERDLDCAERDFREAHERGADGVMPLTGLGSVELRRGNSERAEAWFRAALEIQRSPTTLLNYAWSIVASATPRRMHEAETICRDILQMNPDNPYAIGCLGAICFIQGDRVRAEHHLAEAISRGNSDTETLANLGAIRARLGHYQLAEKAFLDVLQRDPLHVRSHVELSQLFIKQEKFSEARLAARRAIDADPSSSWGWRAAAAVALATDDPKTAEAILREGLAIVAIGDADALHLDLVRVLITIGDSTAEPARYTEGKAQIAHVITRNPTHPSALLLSGLVHLKLSDPATALRILTRVRETSAIAPYLSAYRDAARSAVRQERLSNMPLYQAMLFLFVVVQTLMVWWYVGEGKIGDTVAGTIIPLLAGILLLAIVLPRLAKFKVVTVEGELMANLRDVRQENLAGPAMHVEAMPSMSASLTALSYDI